MDADGGDSVFAVGVLGLAWFVFGTTMRRGEGVAVVEAREVEVVGG